MITAHIAEIITLLATFACAIIDGRTGFIPNRITYPAFIAILLSASITNHIASAAFGTLCVGGTLASLHLITNRRGLGLGDVKLGACIGAGFGPIAGLSALAAAFIMGGTFGTYLLAARRAGRKDAIRFGPFLAFGASFAMALQTFGTLR